MEFQNVRYYHGCISRSTAEDILQGKPNGSFLLRKSLKNDDVFVISLVAIDKILHFSVEKSPSSQMYRVSHGSEHPNPVLVCEHYIHESSGLKTKLLHPVYRQISYHNVAVQAEELTVISSTCSYEDYEWYHGSISREEDSKRLSDAYFFNKKNGIFLVRRKSETQYVLSIVHMEKVHRYILNEDSTTKQFYFDETPNGVRFSSLEELLEFYRKNPPEVTGLKCQLSIPCRRNHLVEEDEEDKPSHSKSGGVLDTFKHFAASLANELKAILPSNSLDMNWSESNDGIHSENKALPLSRHPSLGQFNRKSMPMDSIGFHSPYMNFSAHSSHQSSIIPDLFINKDKLSLMEELGSGHFGSVRFAECNLFGEIVPCAVKILSGSDVHANKEDLLQEASVMQHLDHPYIVRLLAVCDPETDDGKLMLVLELAPLGTLRNFIKKKNEENFPEKNILLLMNQVCEGMAYLSSHNVVHRDLAARNILLVTENFVKISDFGMSRVLHDGDYYKASSPGSWPLRWYAPEALLYFRFTSKSDVWSYGITVWEVCSYGSRPYRGMRGRDILEMLECERRLPCPNSCSPDLYNLLLQCWAFDPDKRPTFDDLLVQMKTLTID